MSWAIERKAFTDKNEEQPEVKALRDAISKAADHGILLFCANPDKGPGEENKTYPHTLSTRIFCIGAASEDGKPWGKIGENAPSDFYLPGVDLGKQGVTPNVL